MLINEYVINRLMTGRVTALSIPYIVFLSTPSCNIWQRQIINDRALFSRSLSELSNFSI